MHKTIQQFIATSIKFENLEDLSGGECSGFITYCHEVNSNLRLLKNLTAAHAQVLQEESYTRAQVQELLAQMATTTEQDIFQTKDDLTAQFQNSLKR